MTELPVRIVAAGLLSGVAAGFAMHRSGFCIAGAFRDLFLLRRGDMLRVLALTVLVSIPLFDAARRLGLLPLYPFPLLGAVSPANFLGGVLFGIGMVLAGGCVMGTLYRAASGSLLAMSAIAGLVAGSGIYAAIHPTWAGLARSVAILPGRSTLPQILGIDPTWLVAAVTPPGAVAVARWARDGLLVRSSPVDGYLQPWKAGVVLAVAGLVSWMGAGMPMGITTSYAKAAAAIGSVFAPSLVEGAAFFRATPLDVSFPSGLTLRGGPGPSFDGIAVVQLPLILGIASGSLLSAATVGELRFRWRVPPVQLAAAFAGGVLMALASRLAPGCNVWHVLGGLPIFSATSILFVLGLFPGAWVGSRALSRII